MAENGTGRRRFKATRISGVLTQQRKPEYRVKRNDA
jgi:hypothetical protein